MFNISAYHLTLGLGYSRGYDHEYRDYVYDDIRDDQITASSYMENNPPWDGRLDMHESSWMASNTATDSEHWIQIDFLQSVSIIGILIQGGGKYGRQPYVTSFQIAFGNNETLLELYHEKGRTKVCNEKLAIVFFLSFFVFFLSFFVFLLLLFLLFLFGIFFFYLLLTSSLSSLSPSSSLLLLQQRRNTLKENDKMNRNVLQNTVQLANITGSMILYCEKCAGAVCAYKDVMGQR